MTITPAKIPARRRNRAEPKPTPTLDERAWIEAAFDALAAGGIDRVRVEPLARTLGVTRGSFYWHFADRAALHGAMLVEWRRRATLALISRVEQSRLPVEQRLQALLELPFNPPNTGRGARIELAIRQWAHHDGDAAGAIAEVDRLRLEYFDNLMREHGLAGCEAKGRSLLLYAYMMSATFLVADIDPQVRAAAERMLLAPAPQDA